MRPSHLLHASLLLCAAARLEAVVFTVDTTSDAPLTACTAAPNDCSLRGTLALANGVSVAHEVQFTIPMSDAGCVGATGVCTIRPGTPLPDINPNFAGIVVIDGQTQPGTVPNTLAPDQGGTNAQLKIVINGSSCNQPGGCDVGLRFNRSGTTRGLVINGFRTFSGGTAVVPGFDNGGVVEGCFLGTDVTGTVAVPNGRGIFFGGNPFGGGFTTNGRIGGLEPAQRNLISGNISGGGAGGEGIILDGAGHQVLGNLIGTNAAGTAAIPNDVGIVLGGGVGFVQFVGNATASGRNVISGNNTMGIDILGSGGSGGSTNGSRITGNFIGTDVSGTLPLGNTTFGVQIRAPPNGIQPPLVGGTAPGEGNVIAFNGTEGVAARNRNGNISGNRMFANARLGISLNGAGRTPNDPGDTDPVENRGQNYPDISAFALAGPNVNLSYRVDSATTSSAYPLRVEFFRADGDEGRDFLGSNNYTSAEAQTVKAISLPLPAGVTMTADDVVVGTATDANGETSEFSFSPATLVIQTPTASPCSSTDSVFCNGFESGPQQSLLVRVGATATSGPFAPNGVVNVTDNRGGSCTLTLLPVATPLASEGACILVNSGAAGPIAITATLNTFRSAFGSASGGNVSVTSNFDVQFVVAAPSSATAGTPFEVMVAVRSSINEPLTSYRGTVRFTSNDPAATLPADYTFTAADTGASHTFDVTLRTAGASPRTVTVTDIANAAITATRNVAVGPGAPTQLVFSQQPGNSNVRSSIVPAVNVSVRDAANNIVTNATGNIGVALGTNPNFALLLGTTSLQLSNGMSAFGNLQITNEGSVTLAASWTGGLTRVSNPFTVTDNLAPAQPGSFTATALGINSVALDWTAPGDDLLLGELAPTNGPQGSYRVCITRQAGTPTCQQSPNGGVPVPSTPGSLESFEVAALAANSQYTFSVQAFDGAGNASLIASSTATTDACPIGYTGDSCDQCAIGFHMQGGVCVPDE